MKTIRFILTSITLVGTLHSTSAQDVHLHVNTKWDECSFQIDPSLTQDQWHQFAKEAAMVVYFRTLTDAKPLGAGRFEFSILQWNTKIDETTGAWNNTFVHPDSAHWLIGGNELPFPGISMRAGITSKIDAGVYWSKRPGANYGVWGGQVQYNFFHDTLKHWNATVRISSNSLYGPDDLSLNVFGADFLVSKEFNLHSDWLYASPYVGLSSYLSHAHETTEAVQLENENITGTQYMAGVNLKIKMIRVGVEYNFGNVNTLSYKLGVNFKF